MKKKHKTQNVAAFFVSAYFIVYKKYKRVVLCLHSWQPSLKANSRKVRNLQLSDKEIQL